MFQVSGREHFRNDATQLLNYLIKIIFSRIFSIEFSGFSMRQNLCFSLVYNEGWDVLVASCVGDQR